tara:strand:+ start:784 stop:1038 length:255 start_codon:yes stop_codon:yes gene_type:complete
MAKPNLKKPKLNSKGIVPITSHDTGTVSNHIQKASSSEYKSLNFKVTAEFSRDFRTFAASHDMKLNELLKECFELYCTKKGHIQ